MKYTIQDREAGNCIEECETLEEAKEIVKQYELSDKENNCFSSDFYEIVEKGELIQRRG